MNNITDTFEIITCYIPVYTPANSYSVVYDENNRVTVNYNGTVSYWAVGMIPVTCFVDLSYKQASLLL